jgi:hypothetical protein
MYTYKIIYVSETLAEAVSMQHNILEDGLREVSKDFPKHEIRSISSNLSRKFGRYEVSLTISFN